MLRHLALALAATGFAPAQGPLADVPAGYDSVLVVRDVLPSLEAVLASDVLQTPAVREQLEAAGVALGPIRATLAVFARHVPVEIVVATPPRGIAAGAHLWGALLALMVSSVDADDADAVARLKTHVAALADLDVAGHVRARDANTAELWFDALTDQLDALPADEALRVAITGETIDLVFEPFRWRGGQAVTRVGLPATLADQLPLRWIVQIRREAARISFRVGKAGEGRLDPAVLGKLWRDAPDQLFFARLNADAALVATGEVLEFLANHEEVIDGVLEQKPGLGLLLQSLGSRFESLDPTTTYALNLIEGGVELLDNTDFGEGGEVDVLPAGGVLGYVDPTQSAFYATSLEPDLMVHVMLEAARGQVVERAARDQLAERVTFATRALAVFDEDLMTLREFFAADASACFAPGIAFVLEGTSEVAALVATTPAGEAKATLDGCRLPAFAVFGRLLEDADAWQFALACSANALAALGPADAPLHLAEVDLGLGVPTRVVPWSSLARGGRSLRVVGDLQPHWFVHAGSLAFSTSPALSRRLLARHAEAQVEPPQGVMGWCRYSGAAVADAIDQVADALVALSAPGQAALRAALGVQFEPARAKLVREGCDMAAALARRIGRIEMVQRLDGRLYDDRITVMWGQR